MIVSTHSLRYNLFYSMNVLNSKPPSIALHSYQVIVQYPALFTNDINSMHFYEYVKVVFYNYVLLLLVPLYNDFYLVIMICT